MYYINQMTPGEELFHRDMADINRLCAEIEYVESKSTAAYVTMLVAWSSRHHSPAYASGNVVGDYVMAQARARDKAVLLGAAALCKCVQWLQANTPP